MRCVQVEGDGKTYDGYIEITRQTFKKRYYAHTANFRDENCRKGNGSNKGMALSEKIWEIKDKGKTPG